MLSEKQRILRWLYRQAFAASVLDLSTLLTDAAEAALAKSRPDAEAFAHANLDRYWNWLVKEVDLDQKRDLCPTFTVADASAHRIYWYAKQPLAAGQKDAVRLLLQCRPTILQKLDALTDREYEAAGCVVAELSGAGSTLLTKAGNEGGIDFFATMNVQGSCHLFCGTNGPLRIVGQCKKYQTKIQDNLVKEFLQTLNDIRHVTGKVLPLIPAWFRASRGPIIGIIISHEGFQSGAESRAKDHGVILADSRDIAEVTALTNKWSATTSRATDFYAEVQRVLSIS